MENKWGKRYKMSPKYNDKWAWSREESDNYEH